MDWTVTTYVTYLLVTLPLTFAVATSLSRNGRVFLDDVFGGDEDLARAVNRLLVVAFYLLNLGFVSLYLRIGTEVLDLRGLIEELSVKIGVVSLVIGVVHFANVLVFNSLRRRHRLDTVRGQATQPLQQFQAQPGYGPRAPAPYGAPLNAAATYAPPFPRP